MSNTTRSTTISVSHEEKQLLDEAADTLYGTTEVPYGATIERLARLTVGVEG